MLPLRPNLNRLLDAGTTGSINASRSITNKGSTKQTVVMVEDATKCFPARAGGFTLLELMIVVVVMAIVSAVVLPEMRGTFDDMLLRSTGRELVSAFTLASSQAITINRQHRVRLDSKGGRYMVEKTAGLGGGAGHFIPVDETPGARGDVDKRIRLELRRPETQPGERALARSGEAPADLAAASSISFYPDGTADECEVRLRDREGFGLGLRINPTTARIRVVKLDRQ